MNELRNVFDIFFFSAIFVILSFIKKGSLHLDMKRLSFASHIPIMMRFCEDNLLFTTAVVLSSITVFVYSFQNSYGFYIFLMCFAIYLFTSFTEPKLFHRKPNNAEISRIIEEDTLNLGNCFAIAFYEQYLKWILPGFVARVTAQQSDELIDAIFFKKLIILIPDSAKIDYALLTDVDSRVTKRNTLEPVERNVCGHYKRLYVNTLYYIESRNIYCVAEFATPLLTLYKMHNAGALNDDSLKQQVTIFHDKLNGLLSLHRREMQDSCLPILYQDRDEPHLISEILIKKCLLDL